MLRQNIFIAVAHFLNQGPFSLAAQSDVKYAGRKEVLIILGVGVILMFSGGFIARMMKRFSERDILRAKENASFDVDFDLKGDTLADFWLLLKARESAEEDLLRAWMVLWLMKGDIHFEIVDRYGLPERRLVIGPQLQSENFSEQELYIFLLKAMQESSGISLKELTAWSNMNSRELWKWLKQVDEDGLRRAKELNYLGAFNRLSEPGQARLRQLFSFKAFMGQYMQLGEGFAAKEDLLFYSQLLGMQVYGKDFWGLWVNRPEQVDILADDLDMLDPYIRAMTFYLVAERAEMLLRRPDEYKLPTDFKDGLEDRAREIGNMRRSL